MIDETRGRKRKAKWALLIGVLVCPLWRAYANVPPPLPEDVFKQYGLAIDDASLISYLQNGLPEDIKPSGYVDDSRWELYRFAVELLTKRKSVAAVPVLDSLLNSPLPPMLAEDLARYTARLSPESDQVEYREYHLYFFRGGCAEALARLGDPAAIPALLEYARGHFPDLKPAIGHNLYPPYSYAFGAACQSLGALGSAEGVDLIVQALPEVPLNDAWATHVLYVLTGQPFGPEPLVPERVAAAAREKWIAWWQENKQTYSVDRAAVARRTKGTYTVRDPESLRDNVRFAGFPIRDNNPVPGGPEAVAWLEKNGPSRVRELGALVNNPDETLDVRREAMKWYARFGGKKALRDLARYVRGKVPFDPADGFLKSQLESQAFQVIKETSPKLAERLTKEVSGKGRSVPDA